MADTAPSPTATALMSALRRQDVTSLQLTEAAIDRIERDDGAINAVVVRDFDRARAAARAADAARQRGAQGPLLGLPVTVKESFNVAGLPTTWGLPQTGAPAASVDAVAVLRLKAAGAVVLGKTNVAARLADWQSDNPVYGRTNNPLDPARSPGGSSGGSAAALAAGFVTLELGSDLFGSLRVPAHACGVFAHKPSLGVVPMRGHVPPGAPELSVHAPPDLAVVGPMARCAADLALALDVLAGADDAPGVAWQLRLPPPRHDRLDAFRVLLLDTHPLLPPSAEVRAALAGLADRLARLGCRVQRSHPLLPDLHAAAALFDTLLMAQIGVDMPEADHRALARQVVRAPTGAAHEALVLNHRDWVAADRQRASLNHRLRLLFAECDLLLCPVLPTTALHHDARPHDQRVIAVDDRRLAWDDQGQWLKLASVAGLPATVMPIGRGAGGLPLGVQIIGPALEDRTPLAFAALVESALSAA